MNWIQKKRLEALALADSQKATTRCALCDWWFHGHVRTGKIRFRHHLARVHGRVTP